MKTTISIGIKVTILMICFFYFNTAVAQRYVRRPYKQLESGFLQQEIKQIPVKDNGDYKIKYLGNGTGFFLENELTDGDKSKSPFRISVINIRKNAKDKDALKLRM